MNTMLLADFYKMGHPGQIPPGVTWAASNWIPRRSRLPHATEVPANIGLNYFLKRYLIDGFNHEFFGRPQEDVLDEYRDVMHDCLGIEKPDVGHIQKLHDLRYLPIRILAIYEGTVLPINVPHFVIHNTHPDFAWLPQYLETLISNVLWKPSTNAATARRYRKIMLDAARRAGEKDLSFVDWQGHDFSYRGLSGTEDAITTGLAHLCSFKGTDTIPALLAARDYYGGSLTEIGGSVPATEHWVMCAWIAASAELAAYYHLITEQYPHGIVSIVSDTQDLWRVLREYLPALKGAVIRRNGKVVIRPDSGDPVNILCGAPLAAHGDPAAYGTLRLMQQALGTVYGGGDLPMINKGGAIYGDGITEERCATILQRTIDECKLSPFNVVFGIGSYTYNYNTRDTFSWKLAPAAMRLHGELLPLEKKPITDEGTKHSYRGLVAVNYDSVTDGWLVKQDATLVDIETCAFVPTFNNSELWVDPKFREVRERVRFGL